jgi:hypothetical protein
MTRGRPLARPNPQESGKTCRLTCPRVAARKEDEPRAKPVLPRPWRIRTPPPIPLHPRGARHSSAPKGQPHTSPGQARNGRRPGVMPPQNSSPLPFDGRGAGVRAPGTPSARTPPALRPKSAEPQEWITRSPSPRPSPPGEGEARAALVENDAPGCSLAFWAEGQQCDGRNRGYRAFKQRPEVLPLPGGEGRGEGEPPSDFSPAPARCRGESPSDFW